MTTRVPTEEEWKAVHARLYDALHEATMKEFETLVAEGHDPYHFRFCGLGAHLCAMGNLIGASREETDRDLMFEYIGSEGFEMLRRVADGIVARHAEHGSGWLN